MSIRNHIQWAMMVLVIGIVALFTVVLYRGQREALLAGIDDKLLTAARFAKATLPDDYHDRITGPDSVSPAEFLRIVSRNNRLCRHLGLQYVWSVMVLDGKIVFTSSTSPSHDEAKRDHAGFLDVHHNPEAFGEALRTLRVTFSSFHNEWGHGRMVLVPERDAQGRVHIFGASLGLSEVYGLLRMTLTRAALLGIGVLAAGMALSIIVARAISRPVQGITDAARAIAGGTWQQVPVGREASELKSLAQSINTMSTALRDRMEERLRLERQIQQAQKLESLGVLAGGIAHDFNNLLTAILGNLDLATDGIGPASPALVEIQEARKVTRRAAELARQMLAYSGKGKFTVQRVDLRQIVEEMTHMLQVSISKKASMQFHFAPDIPAVEADPTQLRQVVMNLVINASEALGERGGAIAVTTGVMQCDRAYLTEAWLHDPLTEGRYVYLEVADTGAGIPREDLPRVFDPFYSTKFSGRGLGLAAVLGIVRGHRGAIKVYSEVGKGTTFKMLLRACDEPADARKDAAPEPAWRGAGTVLVVDDEEAVRAAAGGMLTRLGFRVLTANDGQQALEVYRKHKGALTCVLLDLTMPRMDGEETFRELRRLDPDVRVILSSGYNEQDMVQRFAGKGLTGFVQKPYERAMLAAVLRQMDVGGSAR